MSTASRVNVKGKGARVAGIGGLAAVTVAATVIAGVGVGTAGATTGFSFTRIAGADRYDTSVATAQAFGKSDTVILADGEPGHFPDALGASYLAGKKKAPILLTRSAETPSQVAKQIADSGASKVIIVGGTGVVSQAQEDALGRKYIVSRLAGADRYETAAAVMGAAGQSTTSTALLATGLDFADALGGGTLSYARGLPLALTDANNLPPSTLKALKAAGVDNVIVLGGEAAVSQNVLNQLQDGGIRLNGRIAGADRAETSAKLANYEVNFFSFSKTAVNVASGYQFGGGADALGGGALTGQQQRPLLITNNVNDAGSGVLGYLQANACSLAGNSSIIFGGTGAVSQAVENAMTGAATTCTTTPPPTTTNPPNAGAVVGAPTILDVRATNNGFLSILGVFGSSDVVQVIFNEPVTIGNGTKFNLTGTPLLLGLLPGTGSVTVGQNATLVPLPAGTYEGNTVLAGQAYRLNIGSVDINALLGILPPIRYPVTISGVTPGVFDQDEHLALNTNVGDVTIDKVGNFSNP